MKIKALKTLVGSYGRLRKGDEIDLQPWLANELVALGYAAQADAPIVTDNATPEEPRRGRPRKKDASG